VFNSRQRRFGRTGAQLDGVKAHEPRHSLGVCWRLAGWLLLFCRLVHPVLGGWSFAACLALFEYFRMAIPALTGPPRLLVQPLAVACPVPVLAPFGRESRCLCWRECLPACFRRGNRTAWITARSEDVHRILSCSGFATLYISLCCPRGPDPPPAARPLLVDHAGGIVAGSDTGAYYAGRAFGKRKLFPLISPKKRWPAGSGDCSPASLLPRGSTCCSRKGPPFASLRPRPCLSLSALSAT
jgi:hypothetical protein